MSEEKPCRCGNVGVVVFQSDFGLQDGAVAAMKGVATGIDPTLQLYDLTHQIPPYTIWDGAYRLYQTIEYWPEGTVFVSVVDPGVGSARKSVVAKTGSGHYIVTPDNGTLTLIDEAYGVTEMREIDEAINRRLDSHSPYTFHGRDVYAYTGARLAAGEITYEEVGPLLDTEPLNLEYQHPSIEDGVLKGAIPALDIRFGNVWTNIGEDLADQFGLTLGESYLVDIYEGDELVYSGSLPYVTVFAEVDDFSSHLYFNSLNKLSVATNLGSFAEDNGIDHGNEWTLTVSKE